MNDCKPQGGGLFIAAPFEMFGRGGGTMQIATSLRPGRAVDSDSIKTRVESAPGFCA